MESSKIWQFAGVLFLRQQSHDMEGTARWQLDAGDTTSPYTTQGKVSNQILWLCQVYTSDSSLHTASINSIAFAPHELGLKVAAASSDGTASVLSYHTSEGQWDYQKV